MASGAAFPNFISAGDQRHMSQFLGYWRTFFAKATDAPDYYGEAAGLMAISTLALGHRWVDQGRGIPANLYMLITGDSTISRKSTAVRYSKNLVAEVNEQRIGPRDYTMEGLYRWMAVKDPATGKGRTKFTLFSEEFGSDLARGEAYGGTVREDLCGLYDGDDITKVRAKSDSLTILQPRVSLFGGVAYPLLTKYCSENDWFIGFFMRFLFITPVGSLRPQLMLQPKHPRPDWDNAVFRLGQIYDTMKASSYGLPLSQAATSVYAQFLQNLPRLKAGTDKELAPLYIGRLSTNVLKLALIYQVDIDPCAEISAQAMANACELTTHCLWASFLKVHEMTTKFEFKTVMNKVDKLAARSDGVTQREIYSEFRDRGDTIPGRVMRYLKDSNAFIHQANQHGEESWQARP